MTRWTRFLLTLLRARSRPPLRLGVESEISGRVWPGECDAAHLNHAALLSLLECGRIDLMVRFGFLALARRRRWYFPVTSLAVRFERPLRRFDPFEVVSRIVFWDEVSIWIEHRVRHADRTVATGLVRAVVREGRAPVAPSRVLAELGMDVPPLPDRSPAVERLASIDAALAA
jgi:acyl-CoA thioesterase FadM